MRVLHLIDKIGAGGPVRSLLALVSNTRAARPLDSHHLVALCEGGYPPLLFAAKRLGIDVIRAPDLAALEDGIAEADVVLVHFWNTPALWSLLSRKLPAARVVFWMKIRGAHQPQRFCGDLLLSADKVLLTSPHPAEFSRLFQDLDHALIPGIADFQRLEGFRRRSHQGFNVTYIGTLNAGKLHPAFTAMMSAIRIPDLRILLCGGDIDPAVREEIARAPDPRRFEDLGFRADVLEISDVFGYPLSETSYATSDKSLQEAMMAGVPPVVFDHGGPARFVEDGVTGLVVRTAEEFARAVERLHADPDERERLGENARLYAEGNFDPQVLSFRLMAQLEEVCEKPKRSLGPISHRNERGLRLAGLFLRSLGRPDHEVVADLEAWRVGEGQQLDRAVAALPRAAFEMEGGLVQFRNASPDDPALRFWSGLWLLMRGRLQAARAEMEEALRCGAPAEQCRLFVDLSTYYLGEANKSQVERALDRLSPAIRGSTWALVEQIATAEQGEMLRQIETELLDERRG
jgi:glycosyltransferase involved in cell wall biosynthesis